MAETRPPSDPVWKKPGWITAIVSLVTVIFTIPQIVGDAVMSEQRIEAAKIENQKERQARELAIIEQTLAQQGTERVFLLRYFAATSDDEKTQAWAESEVAKLEALAKLEEELNLTKIALRETETKLQTAKAAEGDAVETKVLNQEITNLNRSYVQKDMEVGILRQQAGIGVEEKKFWVIVGSFKARQEAEALRDKISEQTNELRPIVGIRGAGGYWPVVVGHGTLAEANRIADKARNLSAVTEEPYLTPF